MDIIAFLVGMVMGVLLIFIVGAIYLVIRGALRNEDHDDTLS